MWHVRGKKVYRNFSQNTNRDIDLSAIMQMRFWSISLRTTELEPWTPLLNISAAKIWSVFRTHPNVAKVNSLIVEMGTLCQPGEMTSGECQPKRKKIAQQQLIRIQNTETRLERG